MNYADQDKNSKRGGGELLLFIIRKGRPNLELQAGTWGHMYVCHVLKYQIIN